jgi:hypothetical protein
MLPKIAVKTYQTTLPISNEDVEFRPYIVKEERALLMANQDEKESDMLDAMLNLVSACVVNPQALQVKNLSDVDLQWLFVQIRSKSVGEDATITQKCPHCEKEFELKFDVRNVFIERDETHSPIYKVDLNLGNGDDDLIIEFGYPTAQTYINSSKKKNEVDQTFYLIESCIQKITYNGNTHIKGQDFTEPDVAEFFNQLEAFHLEKIYKNIFATAPKIMYKFETTCPHCQKEISYKVEGIGNFFG